MAQKVLTCLLFVVVLIPVAFDAPLISLGIDDLEMVRHLDPGEFEIYVAQGAYTEAY